MIFPQREAAAAEEESAVIWEDMAFDTARNMLAVKEGRNYRVTGREALEGWVSKALRTPRGVYAAYPRQYGSRLYTLRGRRPGEDTRGEALAMVGEAMNHPAVTGVEGLTVTEKGDALHIRCTLRTVYGSLTTETEV